MQNISGISYNWSICKIDCSFVHCRKIFWNIPLMEYLLNVKYSKIGVSLLTILAIITKKYEKTFHYWNILTYEKFQN